MFSKALFKQSCKANGTMWAIITFAVCFMLACVMLISGSGGIGSTITAVEDTIIRREIEASIETRSIGYYENQTDGMAQFDALFVKNAREAIATNPGAPLTETITSVYAKTCADLSEYVYAKAAAINPEYTPDSNAAKEMLASVMYAINPNGMFDEFYQSHGEPTPDSYDVLSLITHLVAGDIDGYVNGEERLQYVAERSETCSAIFLAGNITLDENVDKILVELARFGVDREKYDSFGYDYGNIKHMAVNTVITYRNRLDYELGDLNEKLAAGEISAEEYAASVAEVKTALTGDVSSSLLASLPSEVASALMEVGELDLYGMVVGTIFYKLAGLLLPIIFVIMASNNLIAGQVDSGSMAYILSTSTRRQTVVFTQAAYLIGSLVAMFGLTTATGCVCLAIVGSEVSLGYSQLILLNVGALLVLFALSGLCFFTSCWFDRSKRSMAIGGGLSIFALVAAMLGLFGSPVMPAVIRMEALNNFNYLTVITLFDAMSIIDGTMTFFWKFAILLVLGIIGYVAGSIKFVKKDLPL